MDIDRFNLFQEARVFYSEYGVKYIETPWIVGELAIQLTIPPESRPHKVKIMNGPQLGFLVASAEQGFLQMAMEGRLDNNKPYMSISPCFRDDQEDELHQEYFMKLELFMLGGSYSDCDFFKKKAFQFFESQGACTYTLRTAENSYDLNHIGTNIELGSYYHREVKNLKWACGTGLAQPRFDIVRSKNG